MKNSISLIVKSRLIYIPVLILIGLFGWWVYIQNLGIDATGDLRQLWAVLYQIMALYGAVVGIFISQKWGGYKSKLGRVILAFSIGLLLQSFGQSAYSYYIYFAKIEVPYPSLGDVGFFGSVLAYIYAVVVLSKVSGLKVSLRSLKGKVISLLIPIALLIGSYLFFLRGYEFDWSNKLKIFLDFGYPLGQAFYLSIAVLALIMCTNILGGIMRKPILFLIFALLFQYFSDFMFLYQANKGTWIVGTTNDLMYFISYFLMTLALIYIGSMFKQIKES